MTQVTHEGDSDFDSKWPVRRSIMTSRFDTENRLDPECWFEKNKLAALRGITIASDDLRFNRLLAVSMLSEAWDGELFKAENFADDVDRLYQIGWLQYFSTLLGLLSVDEVGMIRTLSEAGAREVAMSIFSERKKRNFDPVSYEGVVSKTVEQARQGKIIGIFHGSFDPPTWVHLSLAGFYHQFCDQLIIGVDSNEMVQKRKGSDRPRYVYLKRNDVWRSFPHIVDHVVEIPASFYENGVYNDEVISDFYRNLGVGIVFFSREEAGREGRIRQITAAGARPFEERAFGSYKVFSSSKLIELKSATGAGKMLDVL